MTGRVMAFSMTLALLILESSVSRSSADDRDKLLGTWKLLSAVSQNLATSEKTDIYKVLAEVADQQAHSGMIVLISDLFVPREGLFKGLKLLRHRGHDVMIFQIMDDEELDFNYSGTTRFEGMEAAGQ